MKGFSVCEGDHIAVVGSGAKPHPIVGHYFRSCARDETQAVVFKAPPKGLTARAYRIERRCLLYVVSRGLRDLYLHFSVGDLDPFAQIPVER